MLLFLHRRELPNLSCLRLAIRLVFLCLTDASVAFEALATKLAASPDERKDLPLHWPIYDVFSFFSLFYLTTL
jgi:hypothetical protein